MTNRAQSSAAVSKLVLAMALAATFVLPAAKSVEVPLTFSDSGFEAEILTRLPPATGAGLAFAPDGRLFVWEREGVVRVLKNGVLLPTPFLDLRPDVERSGAGLRGVALDPDFQRTQHVFLLYAQGPGGNSDAGGPSMSRLVRVTADPSNPDVALAESEVVVLDAIPSAAPGAMRFAPDGTLLVAFGTGGDSRPTGSPAILAQDLAHYGGKLLRVNPDGSAPPDNPYSDGTDSVASRVWFYGLRTPSGLAIHPDSGEPIVFDAGRGQWQEVNSGPAGANFGWPCHESTDVHPDARAAFPECRGLAATSVTVPIHAYETGRGAAIIAGAVYQQSAYPAQYRGNVFFADHARGWIRRLVLDPDGQPLSVEPFAENVGGPVQLELGPDGQLYYLASETGQVGRIRFTGPVAQASAAPDAGRSPLTVTFSSAGSRSPNGPLAYDWDFGDGATSDDANPVHTYQSSGVRIFTATLGVTDAAGLTSVASVPVTVGSHPPVATIERPSEGAALSPGAIVAFQGSAVDAEDGTLPSAALEWSVRLRHGAHVHLVGTTTGTGGTVSVADHGADSSYEIALSATDSSGLTTTTGVTLPVITPAPSGPAASSGAPPARPRLAVASRGLSTAAAAPAVTRFDFTYPDRGALLAGGWTFVARTAAGGTRNTEQTGSLAISYNQTARPGRIRIPLGPGELWQSANNSQNTPFRDLPADWTSIRLKIAAFDPRANYQQVGLIAYEHDDKYVNVQRSFNSTSGGPVAGFFTEAAGVVTRTDRRPLSNTGNLILRLDRAPAANSYTGFYSTDDGVSWVQLTGTPSLALSSPRLAIQVGANEATGPIVADLAWVEIHSAGSSGGLTLTSVSPTSGRQGQALTAMLTGNGFVAGTACNFGAGVTVTACTFSSSTQLAATLSIMASATVGARTVSVTTPNAQTANLPNGFAVTAASVGQGALTRFTFNYPDRAALLADGWDFLARTAAGGTRNTEEGGALAVSYDQAAHPGTIRIPLGVGEIWQAKNNSQNTLFHDLPTDWTSVRLRIAAFTPRADFQQVGLLVYEHDDKYVNVQRNFHSSFGGPVVGFFSEVAGVPTRTDRRPLSNTGNLTLRLDRVGTTNSHTAYYSTDQEASWVQLTGTPAVTLSNPRLAIQVGDNETGGPTVADLAWVEIHRVGSPTGLALVSVSPSSGRQGQALTAMLTGNGFVAGTACNFGAGVTVTACALISATQLRASLVIAPSAAAGGRTVSVTTPAGQTASAPSAFIVSQASLTRFEFAHQDANTLRATGWSFVARTATGGTRNTEQTGSLAVSYDQAAHPGVIRIPLGPGELWQTANNSQNTLLRDLPADWTSVRLKIAAFDPRADHQQVGLLVYEHDDKYVNVQRNFDSAAGGPVVGFFTEVGGITTRTDRRPLSNTGNLILRLDRARATNTYTASYSTDDGASWVRLTGAPAFPLTNPRLAIQVGANLAGGAVVADLAWVEILAKRVYLANDDHTDYMWTGDEATYRVAIPQMLDYYLDLADGTASNAPEHQSRFAADGSIWVWEYEQTRSPAQLQRLINRIRDGHVSVPLNFLVPVHGGTPTEGVLRSMYYSGQIERKYGLRLTMAVSMEKETLPYGLPSLWAGSGAKYSWKGVCGCYSMVQNLDARPYEIYWATGPDGSKVLMKWHSFVNRAPFTDGRFIGGYAEARSPGAALSFVTTDTAFRGRYPYDVYGVFGKGWDDLQTMTSEFVTVAQQSTTPSQTVIVSNEEDFFKDFEAMYGAQLPSLGVAFGNEREVHTASLAELSARVRRAIERLRSAEALATLVSLEDPSFMKSRTAERDRAWVSLGFYYDHDWNAHGPVAAPQREDWQYRVAGDLEAYVNRLQADAAAALAGQIRRSGTNLRFFVFNPLSWPRSDVADIPFSGAGPVHVVDLATGQEVPSQVVVTGQRRLRVLAPNVPPVGYKVLEVRAGAGQAFGSAAMITGNVIENSVYRATVSSSGAITSLIDKTRGNREFVRVWNGRTLNHLAGAVIGSGAETLTVEDAGPVSATLRATSPNPLAHTARITLFRGSPRIDIQNEITQNFGGIYTWTYSFELPAPDVWHEEVGAVIRARLLSQGGQYAERNARYEWLTLNHFAAMNGGGAGVTLSSADTMFMQLGGSTSSTLDVNTPFIKVLAGGQVDGAGLGFPNQGGDRYFLQRFALTTHGAFDATAAMRFALEHQNPLVAEVVTGGAALPETTVSLLTISDPNVLLWALKPAEEGIGQGVVARLWNLSGQPLDVALNWSGPLTAARRTTHLETDLEPAVVTGQALRATLAAKQLQTYRLLVPLE